MNVRRRHGAVIGVTLLTVSIGGGRHARAENEPAALPVPLDAPEVAPPPPTVSPTAALEPAPNAPPPSASTLRWSVWTSVGYINVRKLRGEEPSLTDTAGPEFAAGFGLRFPMSQLWEFQTRAGLGMVPASGQPTGDSGPSRRVVSTPTSVFMLIPAVDATFRVHLGAGSRWYLGFGPRLGVIVAFMSYTTVARASTGEAPMTGAQSIRSGLIEAVGEFGATFGERDSFELVLRPMGGFQTAVDPEPVGGGVMAGSYSF